MCEEAGGPARGIAHLFSLLTADWLAHPERLSQDVHDSEHGWHAARLMVVTNKERGPLQHCKRGQVLLSVYMTDISKTGRRTLTTPSRASPSSSAQSGDYGLRTTI